jgi:hypothetical protein
VPGGGTGYNRVSPGALTEWVKERLPEGAG